MKLLKRGKDGGSDSTVDGFWLFEIKSLFSIALLRFGPGSRDNYHDHAFHAASWLLSGELEEQHLDGFTNMLKPSWKPIITPRSIFHKVFSKGTSWVLTFRGPWAKIWHEFDPIERKLIKLTHERKVISG